MDTANESIVYETQPDDIIDIGDDNVTSEGVDDGSSSSLTPLKRYVNFLPLEKGRSLKWICGFGCKNGPYTGSYSRVRAHLIGLLPGQKAQGISLCSKVKKEEREKMKKEELEAQKVGGSGKKTSISIIPTITRSSSSSVTGKRGIVGMFDTSSRNDVDAIIARCFYANGLPFNLARSPFFYDMIRAVNEAPKGYKPPSSEKIRTNLLEKEKGMVEKALIPLKDLWPTYGVSIVSDGWTNIKNQSLINVMAISGGKAMYLLSVDCSGDEKMGEFISEILLDAIEKVGRYSVVQVLTDNAANCKKAGDLITAVHPHISWSGCMAHTLSLLMKDIANPKDNTNLGSELAFVADVYGKAKKVIDYIKHHSLAQFIFRSFSELDVIQTKKTRFGSHYVMLERIVRVKRHLINMVLSEEWAKIKKGRSKQNIEYEQVRKTILDEDFWENAKFVLSFTKPIWIMICFCDSDKSVIGVVYPKMRIMLENIKAALVDHAGIRDEMVKLVISRWEMMNRPLHSLAYVLNPYYHSQAWLKGDQGRKPHADPYVAAVYLDTVDKIVRDSTERVIVRQQIGDFLSSKGPFARPQAIADRDYMAATTWWGMYGVTTVELHSLAVKILAQSVNSSCAERAWSTYSYIHSVKRNNLNASRAESLVFIHYNQRLLSWYRKDYEEEYKNWDVFANNDNLDFDNEGVEDREYNELFNDDDNSFEPTTSQAHGSSSDIEETRRREISRGKRPRPQ